ncbi:hypothetical protein F4815DRAFT_246275 [Daldinia loculata]|nr:hypothetical protein F4815DRAFT_246275 [Daldinia loculata]
MKKTRTWDDFIDPVFSGRDYNPSNGPQDRGFLNTYAVESFDIYKDTGPVRDLGLSKSIHAHNEKLWDRFKCNFNGWTIKHFTLLAKPLRRLMVQYLYNYGLYFKGRTHIDTLIEILNSLEWPRFPDKIALEKASRSPDTFISQSNPHLRRIVNLRQLHRSNHIQKIRPFQPGLACPSQPEPITYYYKTY